MSASPNTLAASGTMRAPWASYWGSSIADPSPAPAWTRTSWPCSTSSRTPAGVSATRYSSVLISVGTPTFTLDPFRRSSNQLAPAEREPEVDPVARRIQRAPGELLDPPDAVAKGMAMAEQLPRGALPLAVALDEGLQGPHELAAVGALPVLDGSEDGVAEQAQGVVVLEREEELEGAQVPVGGEPPGARPVLSVAVLPGADPERLERAARLVEGAAEVGRRHGPP